MTCILSILYHNLNAVGPLHLNAEYSGINCLNISLGGVCACVNLGLTSLSTIFQSYHDDVWLRQEAQCSLL